MGVWLCARARAFGLWAWPRILPNWIFGMDKGQLPQQLANGACGGLQLRAFRFRQRQFDNLQKAAEA